MEVIHKQVGGCLISFNLQLASHKEVGYYLTRSARIAALIAQIDNHQSLTRSVRYLCRYIAAWAAKKRVICFLLLFCFHIRFHSLLQTFQITFRIIFSGRDLEHQRQWHGLRSRKKSKQDSRVIISAIVCRNSNIESSYSTSLLILGERSQIGTPGLQ